MNRRWGQETGSPEEACTHAAPRGGKDSGSSTSLSSRKHECAWIALAFAPLRVQVHARHWVETTATARAQMIQLQGAVDHPLKAETRVVTATVLLAVLADAWPQLAGQPYGSLSTSKPALGPQDGGPEGAAHNLGTSALLQAALRLTAEMLSTISRMLSASFFEPTHISELSERDI